MNKQELIAQLATKFLKVGEIENAETSVKGLEIRMREGVMWYRAGVYDVKDGVMARKAITFYVQDEGKPSEAAFMAEKLPEPAVVPPPGFDTALKEYLAGLGWIGYSIASITPEQRYALIQCYTPDKADGTKAVATGYIVKQEGDDKFSLYLLNGTATATTPSALSRVMGGIRSLFAL